ncbi:sigma-70 family RNA polymerase sigma factor, partial [candidate division WOR-3 bacterium]|nr:sigma-70 family RNA polymerase sigma factor [candidate division WOR-3 bacterium]
ISFLSVKCFIIAKNIMYESIENELDLIQRALVREENACQRLIGLYKGRVFSYVYRIIRSYDDAEEIALDTFVRCFKSLDSFDQTKTFSTWVFTIAHNLTVDFLRKRKQEYEYLDETHASQEDFIQEYEKREQLESIEKALTKLEIIDREIVVLFYIEDKSYQEISEILDIPKTTIKTRLHRARLRLRDLVRKNV